MEKRKKKEKKKKREKERKRKESRKHDEKSQTKLLERAGESGRERERAGVAC